MQEPRGLTEAVKLARLHRWPTTSVGAIALQRKLAALVRIEPLAGPVDLVAGVDAAFSRDGRVIAGIVLWRASDGAIVERRAAQRPLRFPYIPGLLSFRELPALLAAFRTLRTTPDAVLCDAQGLAHPRGFGLACHLGLWLQRPTIGCAKSRLCGEYAEPRPARGAASVLTLGDRPVGAVLRTRDRAKPLFVSPGWGCDTASAVGAVLSCTRRYRLPEPARLAHQWVTQLRVH